MNSITCPHCSNSFSLEGDDRTAILNHIRDEAFEADLTERLQIAEREKDAAVKLAVSQSENELQQRLSEQAAKLQELQNLIKNQENAVQLAVSQSKNEMQSLLADKEKELQASQAQLKLKETEQEHAVKDAVNAVNKDLQALQTQLQQKEKEQEYAVKDAVGEVEKELVEARSKIQQVTMEKAASERAIEDSFKIQLADRDESIERLREMKTAMSTKMVGETLELHCENSFNMIRAQAFPNAYFEKDNEVVGGSKGDYVFREYDENGIEIVSIMFEMKNEMDTTATKKKNEDFFKVLDNDRKACLLYT